MPSVLENRNKRFDQSWRLSESGCWIWTRNISTAGYGKISVGNGKYAGAHRFSYELHVGEIPAGMTIDHLCRVRPCVNPAHLEVVTIAENIRRSDNSNRRKTECPLGHEYTEENTYKYNGSRQCRECWNIKNKARKKAG